MLVLIGQWGSRLRRISATYQFVLYTLIGSFFVLTTLLCFYLNCGTTELFVILYTNFSLLRELFFWVLLFIDFL